MTPLKARLNAVLSFIVGLIIVAVLSAPFVGLAAGIAMRLFEWARP